MSYKHNNLMAMRQSYWDDTQSQKVKLEKQYFQQLLVEHNVFPNATLENARTLFFSLPSIIIVKGYALGFTNESVQKLIHQHIESHKTALMQNDTVKIKFRL